MRKLLTLLAAVLLALAATGLALVREAPPAQALTAVYQKGPFWPGNLLDYAGSDAENALNWISVTNATLSDTTSARFYHSYSVQDTVGTAGESDFKMAEGNGQLSGNYTAINVTGGDKYHIGAYFKLSSSATGQQVKFNVGCRQSDGTWIGYEPTATLSLSATTSWQYADGTVTVPSNCAIASDTPLVNLYGMVAGETVNMDDVIFAPYRAAVSIGFYAGATGTDWVNENTSGNSSYDGPAQTNKEFFSGALPSTFSGTDCYSIEQSYTDHSKWPVCIIAYKTAMSQSAITTFVQSIPSDQAVILVYYSEPENNSFSGCSGGGSGNGPQFVCYYEGQVNEIRAAGDYPNVLVSMTAEGYEYGASPDDNSPGDDGLGTNGTSCSFIPPASYVDVWTLDHYEQGTADGTDYNTTAREDIWKDWLKCAQGAGSTMKPIGLGENGFDMAGTNPVPDSTSVATLKADNSYLEQFPQNGLSGYASPAPVLVWNWWNAGNSDLGSYSDVPGTWQSFETQNGGG